MTSAHSIHSLQFDLSLQGDSRDSTRYAEWVQAVLLPVIDEVIDLQAREAGVPAHNITRIQKLEIDLGDIDEDLADSEIARRLRAQLSSALFEQLHSAHHQTYQQSHNHSYPLAQQLVQQEREQHQLQQFLKTGQLPWEYAGSHKYAHSKLIRAALRQTRHQALFRTVSEDPLSLMRLVRQFEVGDLLQICKESFTTWSNVERESLLDWISLELAVHRQDKGYQEDLWLHIFSHDYQQRRFTDLAYAWYSRSDIKITDTLARYEVHIDEQEMWSNASREQALTAIAHLRAQLPVVSMRDANKSGDRSRTNLSPRHLHDKQGSVSEQRSAKYFRDILTRRRLLLAENAQRLGSSQGDVATVAHTSKNAVTNSAAKTATANLEDTMSGTILDEGIDGSIGDTIDEFTGASLPHATLSEIQEAFRHGDIAFLEKHWQTILFLLPHTLAKLQPDLWPRWLASLIRRRALELVGVLQPQAHWIVSRLLEMSDTPQVQALFELALHYALPIAANELNPSAFVAILSDGAADTDGIAETLRQIGIHHRISTASADSTAISSNLNTAYAEPRDEAFNALTAELPGKHLKTNVDVVAASLAGLLTALDSRSEDQLRRVIDELSATQGRELLALLKHNEWAQILALLQPAISSLVLDILEHQQSLAQALHFLEPAGRHKIGLPFSAEHWRQVVWQLAVDSGIHYQQESHFVHDLLLVLLNVKQVHAREWHTLSSQLNSISQSAAAQLMRKVISEEFDRNSVVATEAYRTSVQIAEPSGQIEKSVTNFATLSPRQKLQMCQAQLPHLAPYFTELLKYRHRILKAAQKTVADLSNIAPKSLPALDEERLLALIWNTYQDQGKYFLSAKQFVLRLIAEIFSPLPISNELLTSLQHELTDLGLPFLTRELQSLRRTMSARIEPNLAWLSDAPALSTLASIPSSPANGREPQTTEVSATTIEQALKNLLLSSSGSPLINQWNTLLRADVSTTLHWFHQLDAKDKSTLLSRLPYVERASLAQAVQWKQARLVHEFLSQSDSLLTYLNGTYADVSVDTKQLRHALLHRFLGVDRKFTLYTSPETALTEAFAAIGELLNMAPTTVQSRLRSTLERSSAHEFQQKMPGLSVVLSRITARKSTPMNFSVEAKASSNEVTNLQNKLQNKLQSELPEEWSVKQEQFRQLQSHERKVNLSQLSDAEQIALAKAIQWKHASVIEELLKQTEHVQALLKKLHGSLGFNSKQLQQALLSSFVGVEAELSTNSRAVDLISQVNDVIARLTKTTPEIIQQSWYLPSNRDAVLAFEHSLPQFSFLLQSGAKSTPQHPTEVQTFKAPHFTPANTSHHQSMVRPLLASFRRWQQGALPLVELRLQIEELWQFLTWWLAQCSSFDAQDSEQLMLDLRAACETCTNPSAFLETVLDSLRLEAPLDIALIAEQINWQAGSEQTETINSRSTADPRPWQEFIELFENHRAEEDPNTDLNQLNNSEAISWSILELQSQNLNGKQLQAQIAQLLRAQEDLNFSQVHQMLMLWCTSVSDAHTVNALTRSVESYAMRVPDMQEFLTSVLRKLVAGDDIDLEAMQSVALKSLDEAHHVELLTQTLQRLALAKENAKENDASEENGRKIEAPWWAALIAKPGFKPWLVYYLRENFLMPMLHASAKSKALRYTRFSESTAAITSILMQASPQFLLDLSWQVLTNSDQQKAAAFMHILQAEFAVKQEHLEVLRHDTAPTFLVDQFNSLFPNHVLESISNKLAGNGTISATSLDQDSASELVEATIITPSSPLPRGWRDTLPRLMADAFLSSNLGGLDVIWPEITQYHRQELVQAQNRYMQRAEQRLALLANNSHEKLLDLVGTLSVGTGELLAEIQRHAGILCELWHLSTSAEALFEHCLQSAYHQLFTAQLGSIAVAKQIPMLLTGLSAWPTSATTQAQYLRALYYRLEPQTHGKLFDCVSELVQHERIEVVVELVSEQASSSSFVESNFIEETELLPSFFARGPNPLTELREVSRILQGLQPRQDKLSHLLQQWRQALVSRILAELPPQSKLPVWKQLAREWHGQESMTSASNLATLAIEQEQPVERIASVLFDSISTISLAANKTFSQVRGLRALNETESGPETATGDGFEADARFESEAGVESEAEADISRTIDSIILLLQTASHPTRMEQRWLRWQIMDVVKHAPAQLWQLEPALQRREHVQRLASILDTVDMEYLFAALRPALHRSLPVLMLAIEKTTAIKLYQQPTLLNERAWLAIYEAAFAIPATLQLKTFSDRLLGTILRSDPNGKSAENAQRKHPPLDEAKLALAEYFTLQHQQQLNQAAQAKREQESKLQQRQQLKKKARLLGEEEPIPYGDSNVLNAGMVIIAPYIQRLFNLLELTKDGVFVNEQAAERAVHLLQYVVKAEASTPEYQLTLNKLLCGIHGGVPIIAGIDITPHEKAVIEQMLLGVISHWSALGKTSISGLRQTFLMREGQLRYQDDSWHLRIPTSTFDMLLDRLPWSFAMIKFPWMRAPLHVTWR